MYGSASAAAWKAPQEVRTFFISSSADGRKRLFQSIRMGELFVDVLSENRDCGRFLLHAFVLMPDHMHLLVTPSEDLSLEKCIQYIKGGFAFRANRAFKIGSKIWQKGFNEHRVTSSDDFYSHVKYIEMNPVKAGLVAKLEDYRFSSASGLLKMDPVPDHFRRG
jgi:putative transposase